MRVIGISGKARHGKDTVAGLILDMADKEFGVSLGKFPLALPLKARVYAELNGQNSYEDVFHNKPEAVRRRLQITGTEEGRNKFGPELWTGQVAAFLTYFAEEGMPGLNGVIIPDVRFPNEVAFIRYGGRVEYHLYNSLIPEVVADIGYPPTDEEEMALLQSDPAKLYALDRLFEQRMTERLEQERATRGGLALYIQSNRPTLEGEAALHPSETALDDMDKEKAFDGIIVNNVDTTLDDLRSQLRPFLVKAFLS
jgi:hypothetical protein